MRSVSLLFLGAAAWLSVGSSTSTARAQTNSPLPGVGLKLLHQSVWNGPKRPLDISFQATNLSTASLGDLSIELTVEAPARSRSVYQLSLRTDATVQLLALPFLQTGTLEPGETRTFRVTQGLAPLTARNESAIYPMKVQLLSNDTLMATLRTPMVFLIERPQLPLDLTWTWVLSEPIQYQPNGVFLPGSIQSDIAPGGRLDQMIAALSAPASPTAVDVTVSWSLLDQLVRMASGYRALDASGATLTVGRGTGGADDAARLLAALRTLLHRPGTELTSSWFGDPSLPALAKAGLFGDITALTDRAARQFNDALRVIPSPAVARPPLSQIDQPSLDGLAGIGAQTVLVDPNVLPTAPGLKYNPPPTVRLAAGKTAVTAVLPDAAVAGLLSSTQADPQLAAHVAMGQLATVWFELPGVPGRGAAVVFPDRPNVPPPLFSAFAGLVEGSPWLRPVTASTLATDIAPPSRGTLPRRSYRGFDGEYVQSLLAAKTKLGQFGNAAATAHSVIARLQDDLLTAEGSTFVAEPHLGHLFLDAVHRTIDGTYKHVEVSNSLVTLSSRTGLLPVTVRNDTGYPVTVDLRLLSDRRLSFVTGNIQEVTIGPRTTTYTFPVRAQTTGRFPITVQVLTPGEPGTRDTIAQAEMIVRSTAYNRVALIVTIGAAVFLMAWWGRRFLPRKRRDDTRRA